VENAPPEGSGNGTTMNLLKPSFSINNLLHGHAVAFSINGSMESTIDLPAINLPHSISGTTYSLTGLAANVNPVTRVFAGYTPHLGDPGNGPVPHFPTDRTVPFGTVSIKLHLKLLH
jgi:hypothetical protein